MALLIRPAQAGDLTACLALNDACVPEMGAASTAFFEAWLARAFAFRVAELDGAFAGFVLALDPGADYDSPNFRFFQARYEHFVYVDRIAVPPEHRGAGVGKALYRDLAGLVRGRGGAPRITCEVNLRPRNQPSLDFHARLGFQEVGRQEVGEKEVSLLVWELGIGD